MIIILIIGAVIAISFNIWNHRNPVGKQQQPKLTKGQQKDLDSYYNYKAKKFRSFRDDSLYDSDGNRIK